MPKVAAIQMSSTDNLKENLRTAEQLLKQAAQEEAKLAVLPEMFAIMGIKPTERVRIKEKLGHGMIQEFLADTARQLKMWIVGGTIPLACEEENRVIAASLVYDEKGKLAAHYDKIHLFDVCIEKDVEEYKESDTIKAGTDVVSVDTPIGKLGLSVCYDIRFPELFRCLFDKGVEVIAVPAAFTVKTGQAHWEILLRSRAIENFSYIIGAGQTGSHAGGRKTYGHSMIVEPWGNILKVKPNEVGVITAEIDLIHLKKIRADIPIEKHRRFLSTLISR